MRSYQYAHGRRNGASNMPRKRSTSTCCFLPSVAKKAQSQPTPPSHTEPLVRWTHASSIAGVINILKEGRVKPSTSHVADSRSFFGMGYQISNNRDYDASQLGRVLHCCNQVNKNSSLLLLGGLHIPPKKVAGNGRHSRRPKMEEPATTTV